MARVRWRVCPEGTGTMLVMVAGWCSWLM